MNTIPENIDPLGHAITDTFENDTNNEILVESDIAEDDTISSKYFFRTYDKMPLIEQHALNKCVGKVLDVGAAAGCHSLFLQDKGMDVTALEISQLCCDVMKKRGIRNVIAGNYFDFDFDNTKFDTLLFLMNGIGIAGTLSGLEDLLFKASKLLNPGGILVFDSSDIDYMYYDEDGSKLINLNSNYYGELSYKMKYSSFIGNPFKWLFIDINTLMPIAQKYGFKTHLVESGKHYDYLGILTKK
jgi:SAM-dependent methyltransferase